MNLNKTYHDRVAKFNFQTNKIEIKFVEPDYVRMATRLTNYNVIERTKACNCGK
jgi:hypothetical protein